MTRLSIILPVFNAVGHLHKCLDSILSQKGDDFEVICVDDGSNDGGAALLDDYAKRDHRVRAVHQMNAGVSVARNVGLDVAGGEWVSFIDADDSVSSDYIEVFRQIDIEADLHFFYANEKYPDGRCITYPLADAPVKGFAERICAIAGCDTGRNMMGFTWNKFFRRSLIEEHHVRFVPGVSISEDELFTLNYCAFAKSLTVITTPLYNYRRNDTGLTAQKTTGFDRLACEFDKLSGVLAAPLLRQYAVSRAFSSWIAFALEVNSLSGCYRAVDYFRERQCEIFRRGAIVRILGRLNWTSVRVASVVLYAYLRLRTMRAKR